MIIYFVVFICDDPVSQTSQTSRIYRLFSLPHSMGMNYSKNIELTEQCEHAGKTFAAIKIYENRK